MYYRGGVHCDSALRPGYGRLSESEVRSRLAKGDAGAHANRVLHVAIREGRVVGCCSSTLQPPWTSSGCGHWGLLSVEVASQGSGVASALVDAAEDRLRAAQCRAIQIEYEYTVGDAHSERLRRWYEDKLRFSCRNSLPKWGSSFRCCHKALESRSACAVAAGNGDGGGEGDCREPEAAVNKSARCVGVSCVLL